MKTPPSKNNAKNADRNVRAPLVLACGNAFAAPQAGGDGLLPNSWTIPYGQWPHGPHVHNVGGRKMSLVIRQTFDRSGAVAIANALAAKRAKNHPGIPVYQGHPDAPEFAASHPDKAAIGWITDAVANADGLALTIDWLKNPGRGFAFYSPYWQGPSKVDAPPGGDTPGRATMRVEDMRSLALVNEANIPDFRLPNAADETTTNQEEDTMSKLLLDALGLAEGATEEAVVAAINQLKADLATAQSAATAANAKCEENKTALANAQKSRNDTLISVALANGQITGADKPTWEARLANAFDTEAPALAALPKLHIKTVAATGGRTPQAATGDDVDLGALANAKMKENPGMDFDGAWKALKKERPELFKKSEG